MLLHGNVMDLRLFCGYKKRFGCLWGFILDHLMSMWAVSLERNFRTFDDKEVGKKKIKF